MMRYLTPGMVLGFLFTSSVVLAADGEKPLSAEELRFFEGKIRPVLIEHCYACHSAESEKVRGGLTLDTRAGLRQGGDTGPAVVPGDLKKSLLVKALRSKEEGVAMPPKKPLPEEVIRDLERWVKMGAPDPRDGTAKPSRREIDLVSGRQFWAFQPIGKPAIPTVEQSSWVKAPLDAFILAELEKKKLKPVADAEKATLLRRVYFDLLGLPPTPSQVEAFVRDTSPKAFEKVIDELLASPHYGERWGRHWLDVARYAESTGKAVNFNYPHAWRYRDYVVEAFNADTPYPQFLREQIAGDLLPAKTDADKMRNTVATGFLAIGSKNLNERNKLQFELDLVDEQIDSVTQAVLGLTVACARCHDHKFDPIPMKDYYALAGIFRSTTTHYGTMQMIQSQNPSTLIGLPAGALPRPGTAKLSPTELTKMQNDLKAFKDEIAELTKKMGVRESFLTANGVRLRIQMGMLEAKIGMYHEDGTPKALAMCTSDKLRAK
ncbi:MAG: DUF1549 domain-containing protein, partial [Gemmataceae bacterium]